MKIEITPITNWMHVLNAARFTQRKSLIFKEPSDKFKKQMVIAEHSPLRALMFYIDMYDIPYYVAMHFRTHKLVHLPLVTTSRPDIDGNMKPREEQLKAELVNMRLMIDAQEIIAISRVRLCNRAEKETNSIWNAVIEELRKIEPILADACVPNCIYRGFCPEISSCKFNSTKTYASMHNAYINNQMTFLNNP
jgi:hypothetical protein